MLLTKQFSFCCFFFFLVFISFGNAQTQEKSFSVFVESLTRLGTGNETIELWGIDVVADFSSVHALTGRVALDVKIAKQPVFCSIRSQNQNFVKAQCTNSAKDDLSLFLIQGGYVSVNRREVYGTLYEEAYLEAERQARDSGVGIWGNAISLSESNSFDENNNFILATLSIVVIFMVGLAVVLFLMINGFRRVLDLQNKAINLRGKDQALRHKEKNIVAVMIYSEIAENKEKIGAYLTIHEDMLKNFEVSDNQKLGDIIQKQPVLSRSVFDGNTGKLEIFGERLASEIIHYYARIKSKPDYVEITSDTPREDVTSLIGNAVDSAKKLLVLSDMLLGSFEQHALVNKNN